MEHASAHCESAKQSARRGNQQAFVLNVVVSPPTARFAPSLQMSWVAHRGKQMLAGFRRSTFDVYPNLDPYMYVL